MNDYLNSLTKKLIALPWYAWVVIALLIGTFFLLRRTDKSAPWDSKRIAYAAMCIAVAFILSCIRLYRMPMGGSVTPASMLPLFLFILACGPRQGALLGVAYGFMQLFQGGDIVHPIQMLLDYPLAFAALTLGALALYIPVPKVLQLPLAVVLGTFGRFFLAVLSGVVFFGAYAPEGQSPLAYSVVYNIGYLSVDALLCILVSFLPGVNRLRDMISGKLD